MTMKVRLVGSWIKLRAVLSSVTELSIFGVDILPRLVMHVIVSYNVLTLSFPCIICEQPRHTVIIGRYKIARSTSTLIIEL